MAHRVPFAADPPPVTDGDQIEIRDMDGNWAATTAHSAPRYDLENAFAGKCFLTVAVNWGDGTIVNWPAEDVRLAQHTRSSE